MVTFFTIAAFMAMVLAPCAVASYNLPTGKEDKFEGFAGNGKGQ